MTDAPHVPAAFINAIAEEGTKAEAIEWLQKTWNENCLLRSQLAKAKAVNETVAGYLRPLNELVVASEDDYCSEDTEEGEWREPDDEPVAAGTSHSSHITFGTVRGARHAIDMLMALTDDIGKT